MNLTQVANFQGLTFVRDKKLEGRKYAVQYEDADAIHVSPAVYDLLATDLDQVAKNLEVRIVRRRSRVRAEGD